MSNVIKFETVHPQKLKAIVQQQQATHSTPSPDDRPPYDRLAGLLLALAQKLDGIVDSHSCVLAGLPVSPGKTDIEVTLVKAKVSIDGLVRTLAADSETAA